MNTEQVCNIFTLIVYRCEQCTEGAYFDVDADECHECDCNADGTMPGNNTCNPVSKIPFHGPAL